MDVANIAPTRLDDMEEQAVPFLPKHESQRLASTSQEHAHLRRNTTATTFALLCLSLAFLVAGIWQKPNHSQCTRKLNGWCMISPFVFFAR